MTELKHNSKSWKEELAHFVFQMIFLGGLVSLVKFINPSFLKRSKSPTVAHVKVDDKKFEEVDSIESQCAIDDDLCSMAIAERVVKVANDKYQGTGFILESNENTMTIMTASHVIRDGNGYNSSIKLGLSVYDSSQNHWEDALSACAFFKNAYADVGILSVRNYSKKIFPMILEPEGAKAGQRVHVVDHKYDKVRAWKYSVHSFNNDKQEIYLHDTSESGMSGSPIISLDGKLLGVLTATNSYTNRTIGTWKLGKVLLFGLSYLLEKESYFAPYICRTYELSDEALLSFIEESDKEHAKL